MANVSTWLMCPRCVLLAGVNHLSCRSLFESRLLGFTVFLILSNPTLNETSYLAPCLILAGALWGFELV